jgi:hypothetical protein
MGKDIAQGYQILFVLQKAGSALLALPREARELSELNSLQEGLGLEPVIGFQGVSAAPPKPIGPLL